MASDGSIDLQDTASVAAWSARLGITPVQLKEAVGIVGTDPEALQRYVARHGDPTQREEAAAAERDLGIRE